VGENRGEVGDMGEEERRRDIYVVLEGIDGTGKTTIGRRLCDEYGFYFTSEPTPWLKSVLSGFGVREDGGEKEDGHLSSHERGFFEALMFAADRVLHMHRIKGVLDEGQGVVSDRSYYSTMAYQGTRMEDFFGSLDSALEWIEKTHTPFILEPDLVVVLDVDPEIGMERIKNSRQTLATRFEHVEFLSRVREAFLRLAEKKGFSVVDASRPPEKVYADVRALVEKLL